MGVMRKPDSEDGAEHKNNTADLPIVPTITCGHKSLCCSFGSWTRAQKPDIILHKLTARPHTVASLIQTLCAN